MIPLIIYFDLMMICKILVRTSNLYLNFDKSIFYLSTTIKITIEFKLITEKNWDQVNWNSFQFNWHCEQVLEFLYHVYDDSS